MTNANNISMAEHFRWKCHPFADTWRPNPPFVSQTDKRVIDQCQMLLHYGKSFSIMGPSGVGKSTLVHYLVSNLDATYYRPIIIHYGGLQRSGLLKAIADRLGVETTGRSIPMLVKLQKHIDTMTTGTNAIYPVIIVDDAQLLERESLLDLCSLIVCPPQKTAAASLIIVGDQVLEKKLQLAVMTAIRGRLTANFGMELLSEQETQQFISLRLKYAKAPKDLFESESVALVAAHCRGNRREIMNLATLLLGEAFYRKEKTITAQLLMSSNVLGHGSGQ